MYQEFWQLGDISIVYLFTCLCRKCTEIKILLDRELGTEKLANLERQ